MQSTQKFSLQSSPSSVETRHCLPFSQFPTFTTFTQPLRARRCSNWCTIPAQTRSDRDLSDSMVPIWGKSWHMDLTPFSSMYYDTNIISCLLVLLGFCINTTQGWNDARSQNNLQKNHRELHKQLHANKCLSGILCHALAWKNEADLKREAVAPSNIYVMAALSGLNQVTDPLCRHWRAAVSSNSDSKSHISLGGGRGGGGS